MSISTGLDATSVLQRTFEGQRALIIGAVDGDPVSRQLLSLANGLTPLGHLLQLSQIHAWPAAALNELMSRGYLQVVEAPRSTLPRLVQWHWDEDTHQVQAVSPA